MGARHTEKEVSHMRDPRTESWLKAEGITYEYREAVLLDAIDVEASHKNQARVKGKALIDDLVERYTLFYIDSVDMPALVVKPTKDNLDKFWILDGNQRYAAAVDAELKVHDMFVVDHATDEMATTLLCWTANSRNGDAGTPLDHRMQASHFHKLWPHVQLAIVARKFGLRESTLTSFLRLEKVDARLSEFGLESSQISKPNREKLHTTVDSDIRFREAAKFLQETGIVGNLADEFWADFRRARTDADVVALVERWRQRGDVAALLRDKRLHRAPIPKSKIKQTVERVQSVVRFLQKNADPVSLEVASGNEVRDLIASLAQASTLARDVLKQFEKNAPGAAA